MSLPRRPLTLALAVAAAVSAFASSAPGLEPDPESVPSAPADAGEPLASAGVDAGSEEVPAAQWEVPSRLTDPPLATATPLPREHDLLRRARLVEGRYVVGSGEGARALTVIPDLQAKLTAILQRYQTPYAAVVVMDPVSGRVLAMAEHSEQDPKMRGLAVKALFPAASIFKVVTASALLEAGVKPEDVECSHGGKRKVTLKHLADTARDGACYSLADALAHSANAVFAKLTARHLTAERLSRWAQAYHFNRPIDFPIPTEPSLASVPPDELGLARAGAGFGDVFLSPLHGAVLASLAAQGSFVQPILYEDVPPPAAPAPRVLTEAQASALADMLEDTVKQGTARRVFRERGFRVEGAVGKTGSLADKKPFRDYSWFVGFAPKQDPKVAVAAVVVNGYYWRIRGTWLGREALRLGLLHRPAPAPEAAAVATGDAPPPAAPPAGPAGTAAP